MEKREFGAMRKEELAGIPDARVRRTIFSPGKRRITVLFGIVLALIAIAGTFCYLKTAENAENAEEASYATYEFCHQGGSMYAETSDALCSELFDAERKGEVSGPQEYAEYSRERAYRLGLEKFSTPLCMAVLMAAALWAIALILKIRNPAMFTRIGEKITLYREDGRISGIEISKRKIGLDVNMNVHLVTCNLGDYVMVSFADYGAGKCAKPARERVVMNRTQLNEFLNYLGSISNVGIGRDVQHREGEGIIEFRREGSASGEAP